MCAKPSAGFLFPASQRPEEDNKIAQKSSVILETSEVPFKARDKKRHLIDQLTRFYKNVIALIVIEVEIFQY